MNQSIKQIQDLIHRFTCERIVPYTTEWDQAETFPRSLWQQLGELGLLGITIDSKYGGCSLGLLEHGIIMEGLSYASPSVGLSYAAHSNLCSNTINQFGTEYQKHKFLPKLCSGEHIGALAISEVESGSDAFNMSLSAKKINNGFILNGSKYWITNAPIADTFVVYAKTSTDHSPGISVFIVERNFDGFTVGKPIKKIGMKASPTSEIIFNNCFIPESHLIGRINQGCEILKKGLNSERLILASGPLGIIRKSLDDTIHYSSIRHQFGKPINQFQRIQDKIALIYTAFTSVKAVIDSTSASVDRGEPLAPEQSASVLLHASREGIRSAEECLQTFGGNGYTVELNIGQRWIDAKLYDIGGGTKEIRQHIISKSLIKNYTKRSTNTTTA